MFSIIKSANKTFYNNIYNNTILSNSLKSINIHKYSSKNLENKELILPEISKDLNKWLEGPLEKVIEKKKLMDGV
jgi:hypothetical protein